MAKINCTNPNHEDRNASMEVYSDAGYCFSCGYTDITVADKDTPRPEPENIESNLAWIDRAPKREIRGLLLPYDDAGFFIVWPDRSYWKYRRWDDKPRYIGPRGHKPPLLVLPGQSPAGLVIVEGELNALSLDLAYPDRNFTIASPGSATDIAKTIDYSLTFTTVLVIMDKDAAGVAAGIWFKTELLKRGKHVTLVAVEKDFNQVLQEEGIEGVQKQFAELLGVSSK